jgi:hypothetical protein
MWPSHSNDEAQTTASHQVDLLEKVKTTRSEKCLRDTSASDLVANLIKEEARRLKLPPS